MLEIKLKQLLSEIENICEIELESVIGINVDLRKVV